MADRDRTIAETERRLQEAVAARGELERMLAEAQARAHQLAAGTEEPPPTPLHEKAMAEALARIETDRKSVV